ncbi:hypothetical protein SAMN05216474_2290 [Lishizhenia tianjinensis]|uniref:Uncharacterized protein n=1 Tax=Lishizhenia tianjinensis TaxID=477690 RepID=A0A1I7API3_9FLAO|nr:hypothetical protein [Lishizhenia tianjinensis]SFT76832.1 hypothetical protein SAMN05216474_2290 [Lishizhenia tianjinensis]
MQDIKLIIQEIQKRGEALKSELATMRNDNASLQDKVAMLTRNLENKQAEVLDLTSQVDHLNAALKESEAKANSAQVNDEEIDFLVREIDDCINRLKQ